MCRWLDVSKSGFYEWRSRPDSATAQRRELLKIKIEALFYANDETYGYRRLHRALVRGGEQAGEELVRKLMRELGLVPCQPRPWRHSLTEQGPSGPIPDLVNRDFSAAGPDLRVLPEFAAGIAAGSALQLSIVGPGGANSSRFSSGAGGIIYEVSPPLTVVNTVPACTYGGGTEETANTVYGQLQPGPGSYFAQTWAITAGHAIEAPGQF
jgi:hypothetical protein